MQPDHYVELYNDNTDENMLPLVQIDLSEAAATEPEVALATFIAIIKRHHRFWWKYLRIELTCSALKQSGWKPVFIDDADWERRLFEAVGKQKVEFDHRRQEIIIQCMPFNVHESVAYKFHRSIDNHVQQLPNEIGELLYATASGSTILSVLLFIYLQMGAALL